MRLIAWLLLLGFMSASAVAQPSNAFESARLARQQALAALKAKDLAAARLHAGAMQAQLPNSSAIIGFQVELAASAQDWPAVKTHLKTLAAMGRAGAPSFDPLFGNLGKDGKRLAKAFAKNRKARGRTAQAFALSSQARLIESLAYDPVTGDWYFGSVVDRLVIRRASDGSESAIALPPRSGSVFGMAVDAPRRRLWLTLGMVPQSARPTIEDQPVTGLALFDLDRQAVVNILAVPNADAASQLGDLAVAADGAVFVTDAGTGGIYQTNSEASALEVVVPPGVLRSAQGIVTTPDEGALIVADYASGLALVDRTSRAVAALNADATIALDGIDGLVRAGDRLYAIQNGFVPQRILRLTLAPDGRQVARAKALVVNAPEWIEPTLATVVGDKLYYIAASQWPAYGQGGALNPGYQVVPTRVEAIRR